MNVKCEHCGHENELRIADLDISEWGDELVASEITRGDLLRILFGHSKGRPAVVVEDAGEVSLVGGSEV